MRVEMRFTVTVVGTDRVSVVAAEVIVLVMMRFRVVVCVTASPVIVVVCGWGTDVIVVVRRSVRVVGTILVSVIVC